MTAAELLISWADSQDAPAEQDEWISPLQSDPVGAVQAWCRGASADLDKGNSRAALAVLYAAGVVEAPRVGRPPRELPS